MVDPVFLLAVVGLVGGIVAAYFVFASFAFGAGYEPTPRRAVETMLAFAGVGPADTLYDLGAGTGAIVFRAARTYGARVVGVEVEPIRLAILRLRVRFGRSSDRITIRWGNLFDQDFREATVVTAFLWPGAMTRLRPKLEAELPNGARVVSHCHPVPGWTSERYERSTDVYLYRWPAARRGAAGTPGPTGGT